MVLSTNMQLQLCVICLVMAVCAADTANDTSVRSGDQFVGRLIEEGRTLVHHTLKRFMIILPAIFFKLGVAFTMLVIVTIAAVNNGFIGFLLLVVGLSSVLARLQEARKPVAAAPYYASVPAVPAYANRYYQDWDRSDRGNKDVVESTTKSVVQYLYTPLSSYNPSYYAQTS